MSDTPATRDFGLIDGRAVTGYVLSNRRGTRVCVLDLGGIVQEFSVLADGVRENLVVSFDDAASYADNPFQINKQIGRVAGRIRGAAFDINGRTYRVEANEGRNALHGGSHGLAVTRFNAVAADGRSVVLRSRLQQSADGYPNDLDLDISYRLDEDDRLTVSYRATALGDTVFDPTLHIYWRLDAGLHDAVLHIPQGGHMPADAEKLPVSTVSDDLEVFDFSRPKPLDAAVAALRRETGRAGFDDAYRVPSDIGRPAAVLQAGRRCRISIYSDRNGLVIFTAAPQDFARHDAGVYDALATEAQTLPDSLHWPEFGNIRLNKGDTREATIAYGIESLS
ncbi:galactose mutarotase [Neisseria meningitidis]|uniref:aldose epimerase family protein n=1 Tax=Neisseria meningitidis TaxID=487 RepID=UPI000766A646|nr:aldose epimerase family protein [Neisseria meningitidis]MBG8748264.1 galactose mutarotase [Neisseria meningitidis]RPC84623.1 galactose mutarotase [Neisseria meningitidis]CWM43944.1 aldose 1-epimerase [Neisseria meningitidis]CWN63208.1 aldose 1-epimerase [Neisseria meningitidis]CWO89280.1 aldose 1-epimerase [Neisseria meningitidis]